MRNLAWGALTTLAALLLALLIAEGAGRVTLRNDSAFQNTAAYYAETLGTADWEAGNWLRDVEPHPYFGFVSSHSAPNINNYGFETPDSLPLQRKPGDFVVAVLGGSVAFNWGNWIQKSGRDHFTRLLLQAAPKLANRNIRIVNLAIGGAKQPQQFFIASFFLEQADLFVNLDGLNEMTAIGNLPTFPLEYPIASFLLFWQSRRAVEANAQLQFLASLQKSLLEAGKRFPRLGSTAVFFSLAKAVRENATRASHTIAERAKQELATELATPGRSLQPEGPPPDSIAAAASVWERYTLRQHRLLSSYGKKALFFEQPNQYVPGSKNFTPEELRVAVREESRPPARQFELLGAAAERLRKAGAPVFDLREIFARESRTVYVDPCCHVNELGNRILTDAIVARLGKALR